MHLYILMGVAGCGKSTVGKAVAKRLRLPFIEGDDFHSDAALTKMRGGIALTLEDRLPWIERIVEACQAKNSDKVIVSCSALQRVIRKRLRALVHGEATFIHLRGSPRIISNRMKERQGHYFKADMLAGQFADLELPMRAHELDILLSVDDLVDHIEDIIQAQS